MASSGSINSSICKKDRRQDWSLPDYLIYYVTKNPSSSKVWQNFTETCKYFYAKNPVIVIQELSFYEKKWSAAKYRIYPYHALMYLDFTTLSCKFWVTDIFDMFFMKGDSNIVSLVLPHLYRVDARVVHLYKQTISYDEFLFLSSNVEAIYFEKTIIKIGNDTLVSLENLIKVLPKATHIEL
uniref:Uncharacterized protein n=1 Tax=Panagrolaimus sp. ES5 TaxID=591445 RepID=A0AC34F2N6_9BILA